MERQRHLLTTHLDAIEQLTGLEPGEVNIHKYKWSIVSPIYPEWRPGYWLEYDYVLTGRNYNQHLGWVWVLSTRRFPTDYRREQPYTERRELSPELAEAILRLIAGTGSA
jgi:hypothetical protein